MFNNNNNTNSNPFNNNNNNRQNNLFNAQTPNSQPNNIFNNQGSTNNNLFTNQANRTGTNNLFNQPNQTNNLFANNNTGNNATANNTSGNMFNNGGNNLANNPNNNPMNILNNNQNMGNTIFQNSNNVGNNLFNPTNGGGNNLFNNPGNTNNQIGAGGNIFINQNTSNNNGGIANQPNSSTTVPNINNFVHLLAGTSQDVQIEQSKLLLKQLRKKLDSSNLERISIVPDNKYRNQKIHKLNLKPQIMLLFKNFKILSTHIAKLKNNDEQLQIQTAEYCKKVFEKLKKQKQCLVQNLAQSHMLEQVKNQLQLMQKQMNQFFAPLYNSIHQKSNFSFTDPDKFCLEISKQILHKMNILNHKMDDIIACQSTDDSEQIYDTSQVIDQLVEYYQNVAAELKEVSAKYNKLKRQAIDKKHRGSYDEVMRRITEKVNSNVSKQFKCYQLIKEIDIIIEKRQQKQKANRNDII